MPNRDIIVELIGALAEADGKEPSGLDFNLSTYIDTEVLVRLDSMETQPWELTFRVSDHQVRITHEGRIFVDGVIYASDAPRNDRPPPDN